MSALHGNTRLLGLRDNQFTWQHRAKNIWTALKITGEREKKGSSAFIFLSLHASRWCYSAEAGSKVHMRDRKIISERVYLSKTDAWGERDKHAEKGDIMTSDGKEKGE